MWGSRVPRKSPRETRTILAVRIAAVCRLWTRIPGKSFGKAKPFLRNRSLPRRTLAGTQLWAPAGASIWSTPTVDVKLHAIYVSTGNAFTGAGGQDFGWDCGVRSAELERCCGPIVGPRERCFSGGLRRQGTQGRTVSGAPRSRLGFREFSDSANAREWQAGVDGRAQRGHRRRHRSRPQGRIAVEGRSYRAARGGRGRADHVGRRVRTKQNVYYSLQTGGVAALRLSDGTRAWFTKLDPVAPAGGGRARRGTVAAVTVIPGVVFAGGWDGVLHALSAADGHELWQTNTAQEFKTVNGVAGKGGSLGAPGPVIVGGTLYVGSGYIALAGNGMPGNVFLAFSPE